MPRSRTTTTFLTEGKVPESSEREDLIKYLKRQTHEALIDGKPSDEKSLKKYQKRTRLYRTNVADAHRAGKLPAEKLGQAAVGDLAVTRLARAWTDSVIGFRWYNSPRRAARKIGRSSCTPRAVVRCLGRKGRRPAWPRRCWRRRGCGAGLVPDRRTGQHRRCAKRDLTRNYFTVYNRTDLQERVLDLLAVTRHARRLGDKVILAGVDRAGLWVQSASPMADATLPDCGQFSMDDETMMAPDLFYPGFYRLGGFEGIGLTGGATPKFRTTPARNFPPLT